MYYKIIRNKQTGKMSDELLLISSWACLVPFTLPVVAVSVERAEVTVSLSVFLPRGFTQPKDMMDNHICYRKETELYTLIWFFSYMLHSYPSLKKGSGIHRVGTLAAENRLRKLQRSLEREHGETDTKTDLVCVRELGRTVREEVLGSFRQNLLMDREARAPQWDQYSPVVVLATLISHCHPGESKKS